MPPKDIGAITICPLHADLANDVAATRASVEAQTKSIERIEGKLDKGQEQLHARISEHTEKITSAFETLRREINGKASCLAETTVADVTAEIPKAVEAEIKRQGWGFVRRNWKAVLVALGALYLAISNAPQFQAAIFALIKALTGAGIGGAPDASP